MMDHKIDKLISAIGDMNTAYLEEAIAFDGAKVGQQKAVRSKNYPPRWWQHWSYWACP